MIHTSRTVTVGKMESVINEPIMLYRGDREVEIEFNIVGSKFMFSNGGNVIKSTNATNGQLVINTPTGENMFSEVTECNDGKVICVITKEMIDELAEVGFYSFQIRLFDESQVSRVTIPPVYQGIEIRNPIAAEDETDLVDIGLVDFSVVRKDNYENVVTFLPNGDYNKTLWEEHDVISKDRLNKVEDALYEINKGTEGLYPTFQNQYDEFSAKVNKDVKAYKEEMEDEVEQFERNLNTRVEQFKIDTNDAMTAHKNEVSEVVDGFSGEILNIYINISGDINVKEFRCSDGEYVKGDGQHDDTTGIQEAILYSYNNNLRLKFPKGVYKITSTLVLPGSKSEFSNLTTQLIGEGIEATVFEFYNGKPLSDNELYNMSVGLLLVNDSFYNNGNFVLGEGLSRDITISGIRLENSDGSYDYGIYNPLMTVNQTLSNIRIRRFNKKGVCKGDNHYYLNNFYNIRVDGGGVCEVGFDLTKGVNTSNVFKKCYAIGCVDGFRVSGIYSTMDTCVTEKISNTCFDLTGFRGTVISPGSESPEALCVFKGGQYTCATITSPYTFGNFTNAEHVHVKCDSACRMQIVGGHIAVDYKDEKIPMPGKLYDCRTGSNLVLDNVKHALYSLNSEYKDYTMYNNIKTSEGEVFTKHGDRFAYLGFDGSYRASKYIDYKSENKHVLANAIYFGAGDSPVYTADGADNRWGKPYNKGDIVLTHSIKETGSLGWVQAKEHSEQTRAENGDFLKIPILLSGTSEERPTAKLQKGQTYFDTTLGIPIYWDGSNWKKYSDNTVV